MPDATHKSMWSGAMPLGGPITLPFEVVKGLEDYEGSVAFKNICECHHQPFKRTETCEGGNRRRTEAMVKSGKTKGTTPCIKGIETDDGYTPIDDTTISDINEAVSSDELEPLAVRDRGDVPLHTAVGFYYLRPSRKVAGSKKQAALLAAYLGREGKVLMVRWSPSGRQHLVAVQAIEGPCLVMSVIPYAQETRSPDSLTVLDTVAVSDKEVELLGTILDAAGIDGEFDLAAQHDESVELKAEAVDEALAGKPVKVKVKQAPEVEETPDLVAALEAAVAARRSRKGSPRPGNPRGRKRR